MVIGGLLLEHWRLSNNFANVAYNHHEPALVIDEYSSGVGICNRIANDLISSCQPQISELPGIPVEKLIANSALLFECIKKASGFK